jgi:hypothetical protein
MAFKDTLPATQYYTQADPYYYTVDNRPLTDLNNRDNQIADELDARTIVVDVTGAASPTITKIPSGWTVTVNGVGDYTINHTLGYVNYGVQLTVVNLTLGLGYVVAMTSNTVQVRLANSAGSPTHMRFNLLITKY